MLRASARRVGIDVDLTAIAHPDRASKIPAGRQLTDFVTAVLSGVPDLSTARDRLVAEVGLAGTIRAAAVVANFQLMNRLVDAVGVPIGSSLRAIAAELDLPT